MRVVSKIKKFLASDDATTAVEYAVLLAMILVAVIIGVTSAGGGVSGWWTNIKDKVSSY
ncbi:MAG TPA: Flp family type IVb pilin [Planctomycetaceae bacterium]|nr:Flp family type IVb pilin [Planctomycetaceae bacterium]HQZ68389.1 Flp family type IVb pilin [Planctomycetaceae bacterium]HRA87301.1 Flp family type IVb pilin [Planctomycetaceae bacterium]